MIVTYLVLKLTLDGILKEGNRLALDRSLREQLRWCKSRLVQLRSDYESGVINETTYREKESEILENVGNLAQQIRNLTIKEGLS